MTNAKRASRKTAKKSTSAQSGKSTKTASAKTPEESVTLTFKGRDGGTFEIDFPKSEAEVIRARAAAANPPKIFFQIVQENPDRGIHDFNLPPDLAVFCLDNCVRPDFNLAGFIIEAVREKINRAKLPFSVPAFEDAIQRALLVMDAQKAKLLNVFNEQLSHTSPDYNAELTATLCGYQAMADDAGKVLHQQFKAVCDFVRARAGSRRLEPHAAIEQKEAA